MNFHTLRNLIKKGEITPVYYFHGPEKFLAEILSEEIIKKKVPAEERDYSVFKFELKETSWEEIVNSLSTTSFFSKNKVVIVELTPQKKKKEELNNDIIFLKNYLSSPQENSYLIVIGDEKEREIYEIFKNSSFCTTFLLKPLTSEEIEALIVEKLKENGKTISPSALAILLEEASEDLSLAIREVEKIITYSGQKERIESEEIESLISFSVRFKIEELIKAIDSLDRSLAFRILENILESYDPVFILGAFTWVYSRRYNNLIGEESQIKLRTHLSEEEKNKTKRILREKIKKIESILKTIFETDIKIKSNPFNKGMIEEMIAKIINIERSLGYEGI